MKSRRIAALCLFIFAGAPLIAIVAPPGRAAPVRALLEQVAQGLTCQCGCGLTVANCNHPNCEFSVPVKDEIQGLLNKGTTPEAILTAFRQKYGEKILSAPTTEGFNLLAWVTPFAIVGGAGIWLIYMLGRWRRRGGAPASEPASVIRAVEAPDPELLRRLHEELRREL